MSATLISPQAFCYPHKTRDSIIYFGDYCRSRRNIPGDFSRKIIELKWGMEEAIEFFLSILCAAPLPRAPIAIVPSHRSDRLITGLSRLARRYAATTEITDATTCLERFESIPKMAYGGHRDERMHFESLRVINPSLIKDQDVLLLDDVVSSGCSLRAGKALLLAAGARSVQPVALARTLLNFEHPCG